MLLTSTIQNIKNLEASSTPPQATPVPCFPLLVLATTIVAAVGYPLQSGLGQAVVMLLGFAARMLQKE